MHDNKLANLIKNVINSNTTIHEDYYNLILKEFTEGESEVYIAINDESIPIYNESEDRIINIFSASMHEGQKTLWVFSNETVIREVFVNEENVNFMKIRSKDIANLASDNEFEKIIIDKIVPIYCLQSNFSVEKISEGTEIVVGLPSKPIQKALLNKLVNNIKKFSEVSEIFHYLQKDTQCRLMIGIRVNEISKSRLSKMIKIINEIMSNEQAEYNFSLTWFDSESEHYLLVKQIDNALIYTNKNQVTPYQKLKKFWHKLFGA